MTASRVLGDVQQRLLRVEQRLYPLQEKSEPDAAEAEAAKSWCATTTGTAITTGNDATFTCDVTGNAGTPLLLSATFKIIAGATGATELDGLFQADGTDLDGLFVFGDYSAWTSGEIRTFTAVCTATADDEVGFRIYNGVTGVNVTVSHCTVVAVQLLAHQGGVCCAVSGGG